MFLRARIGEPRAALSGDDVGKRRFRVARDPRATPDVRDAHELVVQLYAGLLQRDPLRSPARLNPQVQSLGDGQAARVRALGFGHVDDLIDGLASRSASARDVERPRESQNEISASPPVRETARSAEDRQVGIRGRERSSTNP